MSNVIGQTAGKDSASRPGAAAQPEQNRATTIAAKVFGQFAIVWALIVLVIAATILYPGFLDIGNIRNILLQNAPVGMVAIGTTYVLIGGNFDLSIGAVFAIGGMFFALFAGHMPVPAAAVCALGVGAAAGGVNSIIVTGLKVNPFVATLGTASVFTGAGLLASPSVVLSSKPGFDWLSRTTVVGVPLPIILLAVAFLVAGFVLHRTVFGRAVLAVGGNREAARLTGMRVDLVISMTFVIAGMFAAFGGMLLASQAGVGQADGGGSITLDAIAIVIIGGTSLLGGEGAMWRTAVGLLIFATINNLFGSLAFPVAAQELAKGLILIGAVAIDVFLRSRRSHA